VREPHIAKSPKKPERPAQDRSSHPREWRKSVDARAFARRPIGRLEHNEAAKVWGEVAREMIVPEGATAMLPLPRTNAHARTTKPSPKREGRQPQPCTTHPKCRSRSSVSSVVTGARSIFARRKLAAWEDNEYRSAGGYKASAAVGLQTCLDEIAGRSGTDTPYVATHHGPRSCTGQAAYPDPSCHVGLLQTPSWPSTTRCGQALR
jgi:hypothetical protein